MPDVDTRPLLEKLREAPGLPFLRGELGAHRLRTVDEEIAFDPSTGAVTATITVDLTAGPGGFRSLLMLVDSGLLFERVWTDDGDVPFQEIAEAGYRYAQADLPFAAPEGTDVRLHFRYAGALVCLVQGRYSGCDYGGERFDFALAGTLFPILYDPYDYDSIPYYERRLRLTVPEGVDVVVAADRVSEDEWVVPVRHDLAAYVAIFGQFDRRLLRGVSVPTQIVSLAGEDQLVDEMVGWVEDIVDYLDAQAGRQFPYDELTIVKLPERARFPGTAGHGISLLTEIYHGPNDRYFEENLAHETSHVWWAVLTAQVSANSRFLSEGLAMFTQIDYAAERIQTAQPVSDYLARRYNEMEIISRYSTPFEQLPAVAPTPEVQPPQEAYTEWAYLKGAAVLDLLRVSIGAEAFDAGLREYVATCMNVPCDTDDFAAAMTIAAGTDLSWFFQQYVYATTLPRIGIDIQDHTIRLNQEIGWINELELAIELDDGTVETRRVRVEGSGAEITMSQAVVRVTPDPRYEPMLRFSTENDLDVDYDGELDGADLIRCAHQVGRAAWGTQIGDGVTTVDIDFEPRCDTNLDARIDLEDLAVMRGRFPEVR